MPEGQDAISSCGPQRANFTVHVSACLRTQVICLKDSYYGILFNHVASVHHDSLAR